MIRVLGQSLRAHYRGGRLLFLLTVVGVALGVGSVVSIQLINRGAAGSFQAGVDAIYGDVDLRVLPRGTAFPDRHLLAVLGTAGVRDAWPSLDVVARVEGERDDPRPFLEIKGLDLATPGRMTIAEAGGISPFSPTPVLAVARELAAELGRGLGDPLLVTLGSRRVELVVGAFLDEEERSSLASTRIAVMDIAACQEAFGRLGELDAIDVRLADGVDQDEATARLVAALDDDVEVLAPGDQERRARGLLEAFRVNLTALSTISLFVGMFLVYVSVQASLVRRRREFGVLRTLGATPRQVLAVIVVETGFVGALGTAIGVPLGVLAAKANLSAVSTALTYVYLLREVDSLTVPAWIPLLGVTVGIVGSMAASVGPALRMSRDDPRHLLSSMSLHEETDRTATPLALAGLAGLLAGAFGYLVAGDARWCGFALGALLMVAIPLLCPALLRSASTHATTRGLGIGLAARSLGRRLKSGAAAVASLAVAGSMLFGVTTMVTSFRDTVDDWIDATVRADVYVATPSWPRGGPDATIDPEVVDQLKSAPGVVKLDRLRKVITHRGDDRLSLVGVDFSLSGGEERYPLIDGDVDEALAAVRGGGVLLGEPMARRLGLWTGDDLVLESPSGRHALPVAGVYYDYSSATGNVATDINALEELFGPGRVNTVSLYLEEGLDVDDAIDRLRDDFSGSPLTFTGNRRIREEGLRIFDQTFLVTDLLKVICLAIAACGVALTLLVQARELTAETALYRAVGATRPQVFGLFVAKGAVIGLLGLAVALLGGAALYWILSHVINRAYFGWTIQPSFPAGAIARQVGVVAITVVAASLYPALVASRTPATELTREDV